MTAYNKLCALADFVALQNDMRAIFPHLAQTPDWPAGQERRKLWEVTQTIRAMHDFGVLRSDARVLGTGAGTEHTLFYLTNHVSEVHATDLYVQDGWIDVAKKDMLTRPEQYASGDWDPQRLVIQHMDMRQLRYPDNWFDAVFCTSSLEHVGDWGTIVRAVKEMARVARPGGLLIITTEVDVTHRAGQFNENGMAFNDEALHTYIIEPSRCEPVDTWDGTLLPDDYRGAQDLAYVMDCERTGRPVPMPHTMIRVNGFVITSASLVLRKPGAS